MIVFTVCGVLTLLLILARRFFLKPAAELGGPRGLAKGSAAVLIFLWLMYLLFSILSTVGVINIDFHS